MGHDVTYRVESEVMVTIIDAHRALHGILSEWRADTVLAALVAEPETLEELEDAIVRYDSSVISQGFLKHLKSGVNETPWDAGVVIIDLPARLIAYQTESAFYQPDRIGFALYCIDPPLDGRNAPEEEEEVVRIPYLISEDWLFSGSLADWRGIAERRRSEREADPPLDPRPVLFGKIAEFIARECAIARFAGKEDPIAAIHEEWLLTPREDLRGRTPRELMLARREFIDHDLSSRELQWSITCARPPALNRTSAAYRFAGFGTHGNFIYFELIRHLLIDCWTRACAGQSMSLADEIEYLEELQEEYLTEGGDMTYTPGWFFEQERLRIPILAPASMDDLADPEFTVPRTDDPSLGIGFWRLGGNLLNEQGSYAFSLYHTQEEWESRDDQMQGDAPDFDEDGAQWECGESVYNDRKTAAKDDIDDDD
jgi:hypothetical protein